MYTIGIILVLIGHWHDSEWSKFQDTVLEKTIQFIYTFHIPLFYSISGFRFQNSDRLKQDGCRIWIKKKAERLHVPYFFWSLLAVIPKYYLEKRSFVGIEQAIMNLVLIPRVGVWGHFWFLPILFLTYVIFGLVKSASQSAAQNQNWFICIAVVTSVVIYFLPIKTDVLGMADLRTSLVFFAVGAAMHDAYGVLEKIYRGGVQLKKLSVLLLLMVCILLTDSSGQIRVVGLLTALLMIAVCWLTATMIRAGKLTVWISKYTFFGFFKQR